MGASGGLAAAAAVGCEARAGMDVFDELPDHLVLRVLNLVRDARSLARCRPVCRRFNALASHAERLLIQVDAVISAQPRLPCSGLLPLLGHLLRSALQSLSGLVYPKNAPAAPLWRSPADLIQGFPRVRQLEIELPGGDLRLEKGAVVRWKAESGRRLRRCAIVVARRVIFPSDSGSGCGGEEAAMAEMAGGIKENVICTIGVLISASARHYVAREVVRGRRKGCGGCEEVEELEGLVVMDRDGEGTLVMDQEGLQECIHGGGEAEGEEGRRGRRRTEVPAVRMRMRCAREVEVGGGTRMEGAALVVVTAAEGGGGGAATIVEEEEMEAERWAVAAFEGAFRCAAEELLKRPSYSLEMNSF